MDVGGRRKGFDVALIDERRLLVLRARQSREQVVELVRETSPSVIAIDSPRSCAPPGQRSRPDERELNAAVCGIRWTPPREELDGNPYYEWILEGLALYEALQHERVIECFPTASWTRWHGPRSGSRAAWTRAALEAQELEGVPKRTNQDARDAIAAALTARAYEHGRCQCFGEIVVPHDPPQRRGRADRGRQAPHQG